MTRRNTRRCRAARQEDFADLIGGVPIADIARAAGNVNLLRRMITYRAQRERGRPADPTRTALAAVAFAPVADAARQAFVLLGEDPCATPPGHPALDF